MDREQILNYWAKLNGIQGSWTGKESITSPNWCDETTWPVSVDDSTWNITAQNITKRATDDKIAVITRAKVMFCGVVIHATGRMSVEYFSGATKVGETIYASRMDFEKRSARMAIHKATDEKAGNLGDVWDMELDFLGDSKPVALWPIGDASLDPLRLTSFRLKIADDVPYKAKVNSNGEYGYVRYADIRIFDTPLSQAEFEAAQAAKAKKEG